MLARNKLRLAVFGCAFGVCITARAETITEQQVREIIREELAEFLDREEFNAAIARGIENYIRAQRQLAAEQQAAERQAQAKNLRPVDLARDHILGAADAAVTIVEYSDFECPFCKRFHPTMKQFMAENGDRARWVYRHFPLSFHNPGAQTQAEAAECAADLGGNEAFWQYTDAIYARTTAGGDGFPRENLAPLAAEIGVDAEAFAECLNSGRMTERVQQDQENGAAAGVTGTPAIFLLRRDGQIRALAGALPLTELQAAVDELLNADN